MRKTGTRDGVVPSYSCPALAGGGLLTHPIMINEMSIRKEKEKIEIKS